MSLANKLNFYDILENKETISEEKKIQYLNEIRSQIVYLISEKEILDGKFAIELSKKKAIKLQPTEYYAQIPELIDSYRLNELFQLSELDTYPSVNDGKTLFLSLKHVYPDNQFYYLKGADKILADYWKSVVGEDNVTLIKFELIENDTEEQHRLYCLQYDDGNITSLSGYGKTLEMDKVVNEDYYQEIKDKKARWLERIHRQKKESHYKKRREQEKQKDWVSQDTRKQTEEALIAYALSDNHDDISGEESDSESVVSLLTESDSDNQSDNESDDSDDEYFPYNENQDDENDERITITTDDIYNCCIFTNLANPSREKGTSLDCYYLYNENTGETEGIIHYTVVELMVKLP